MFVLKNQLRGLCQHLQIIFNRGKEKLVCFLRTSV